MASTNRLAKRMVGTSNPAGRRIPQPRQAPGSDFGGGGRPAATKPGRRPTSFRALKQLKPGQRQAHLAFRKKFGRGTSVAAAHRHGRLASRMARGEQRRHNRRRHGGLTTTTGYIR
jgi:hypothetical protein